MDFSELTRSGSKSFHQQKKLIQKVLSGKSVTCEHCGQRIIVERIKKELHIRCAKGCINILLDIE